MYLVNVLLIPLRIQSNLDATMVLHQSNWFSLIFYLLIPQLFLYRFRSFLNLRISFQLMVKNCYNLGNSNCNVLPNVQKNVPSAFVECLACKWFLVEKYSCLNIYLDILFEEKLLFLDRYCVHYFLLQILQHLDLVLLKLQG